jgi:hypothetical protein
VGEGREGEGGEGVGGGEKERGVKIGREMVARDVVRGPRDVVRGCTFSKRTLYYYLLYSRSLLYSRR